MSFASFFLPSPSPIGPSLPQLHRRPPPTPGMVRAGSHGQAKCGAGKHNIVLCNLAQALEYELRPQD